MSQKFKKVAANEAKKSDQVQQQNFDFYSLTENQKLTLLALRRVAKKLWNEKLAANPGMNKLQ